ncbi:hypothetical protein YC2023_044399 [Brassica napus]
MEAELGQQHAKGSEALTLDQEIASKEVDPGMWMKRLVQWGKQYNDDDDVQFYGVREECILLLSCKHMCLCKECERKLSYCLLCQSSKFLGMDRDLYTTCALAGTVEKGKWMTRLLGQQHYSVKLKNIGTGNGTGNLFANFIVSIVGVIKHLEWISFGGIGSDTSEQPSIDAVASHLLVLSRLSIFKVIEDYLIVKQDHVYPISPPPLFHCELSIIEEDKKRTYWNFRSSSVSGYSQCHLKRIQIEPLFKNESPDDLSKRREETLGSYIKRD